MTGSSHDVSVQEVGDGLAVSCSCGWSGGTLDTRSQADVAKAAHLRNVLPHTVGTGSTA